MTEHVQQETLVCLDSAHSEFANCTFQFTGCILAIASSASNFDQERIIVWGNLRARETRSVIQTDPHTGWHTKDTDGSSIGTEILRRIFGRDTALHGASHWLRNHVLCQIQLFQCFSGGNHDLILDNVNSSNFFCNCVFDYETRIANKRQCCEVEAAK